MTLDADLIARAHDAFDAAYREAFPAGGDASDDDNATREGIEAVLALTQAEQAQRMGSDLILGEDGRIHRGEVERKLGATLMQTECGRLPLRPVGDRESWWQADDARRCPTCSVVSA
jgi:uncharacterized protein with von Willebrand factor type A (vWA) domain